MAIRYHADDKKVVFRYVGYMIKYTGMQVVRREL